MLFWAVLEFIVYEARYIDVNDAWDRETDREHPDLLRKMRCPIDECKDPDVALRAMFCIFALRVVLAIAFGAWLFRARTEQIWALASSFAAWESLATWTAQRQRTRTSNGGQRRGRDWAALWLLVGAGYGLRVAVGVYLGLGEVRPLLLAAAAAVGAMALGTAFVTMTWALEATCWVDKDGHWTRGMPKPHLRPLLEWALAPRLRLTPNGRVETASGCSTLAETNVVRRSGRPQLARGSRHCGSTGSR